MPSPSIIGDQQPIVGREREQELLRACLAAAVEGRGALVLISGEAGIGKTTLVRDLIQQAEQQGALVLTGGCYDLTTTPPYGPWLEITGAYPITDDALPELPGQLGERTALASFRSQTELFELVAGFFATVSRHRPLVLVLEDLHWSDPASLELLRYLGRSLGDAPILIMITYRDDELIRQHPLFQLLPLIAREANAVRIELQRLATPDIREMVIQKGLSESDTSRLVSYLEQRAAGNPLFTTELLRALETEGTLADGGQLGELDESYLPSFVLQIIERRLAPLDPEARRALEVAAVIGDVVPIEVWETVSELKPEALDATVEQAFAAHILEMNPDHQGLRFTHALIREVLYEGVTPTRRRNWHRSVADALIASPSPDPDIVAFHLEQASDPRLADWLIQAGDRAKQHHARLMAAERFDRAQMLLRDNPERAGERAWLLFQAGHGLRHSDFDRSMQLLEESETLAKKADRTVIAHLARAHQGLPRFNRGDVRQGLDDMRAGTLALERLDPTGQDELDRLVAQLGSGVGVQGRGTLGLLLASIGCFEEARDFLQDWPESEWETSPDAYRATGMIHVAMGQPTQARQAFMRSSEINAALGDPGQAALDLLLMLHQVYVRYETEQVHERRKLIRAMQPLRAREMSVPLLEGPARYAEIPWVDDYLLSGRWNRAQELLDRQVPSFGSGMLDLPRAQLARHQGDAETSWGIVHHHLPRGSATLPGERAHNALVDIQPLAIQLALDAGQIDEARSWLEANDKMLEWSGAVHGQAENQHLWARYHLLAGDAAASRRHAIQALEHANDPRQPLALLAAHRFLGHLDTLDGRFTDAETHLQAALDLADACQTPFERALTLLELARLRAAQGQTNDARELLEEVRTLCEPLKAQPTLDQVAALEAVLEQPSERPIPFGLTPRELDVLRLVAEGLTDPEVAEKLFVSPRTVSSHLTSVYTKLGVSSRAAATRLAVQHGLLSH